METSKARFVGLLCSMSAILAFALTASAADWKTGQAAVSEVDTAAVSYLVVLTKTDKLSAGALAARIDATAKALKSHPAAIPSPIATSARNADGIAALRADIATLAADSANALKSAPESAG